MESCPFKDMASLFDRLDLLEEKIDLLLEERCQNEIVGPKEAELEASRTERDYSLSVSQVAKLTGYNAHYIYQLVKASRIPFRKMGGKVRFDESEIKQWKVGGDNPL